MPDPNAYVDASSISPYGELEDLTAVEKRLLRLEAELRKQQAKALSAGRSIEIIRREYAQALALAQETGQ